MVTSTGTQDRNAPHPHSIHNLERSDRSTRYNMSHCWQICKRIWAPFVIKAVCVHSCSQPSARTLSTPALGQFFFFFVQKNNCTQLIFICALNRRYTVPIETHRFLLRHYTTFSVTLFQVQLPLLAMQVVEGWLQNKTTFSAHTHTHYKSYLRSYVPICTTLIIFFPILETTESTYPH